MAITGGRLLTSHAYSATTAATTSSLSTSTNALLVAAAMPYSIYSSSVSIAMSNSGSSLTWTKAAEAAVDTASFMGSRPSIWWASAPSGLSSQTVTATMTADYGVAYGGGVAVQVFAFYGAATTSPFAGTATGISATNDLTTNAISGVAADSITIWCGFDGAHGGGAPGSSNLTNTAETLGSRGFISGTRVASGSVTANLNAYSTDAATWNYIGAELLVASGGGGGGGSAAHRFMQFF